MRTHLDKRVVQKVLPCQELKERSHQSKNINIRYSVENLGSTEGSCGNKPSHSWEGSKGWEQKMMMTFPIDIN